MQGMKFGKHEEKCKSMLLIRKFCMKGDGPKARFKFESLNEASRGNGGDCITRS